MLTVKSAANSLPKSSSTECAVDTTCGREGSVLARRPGRLCVHSAYARDAVLVAPNLELTGLAPEESAYTAGKAPGSKQGNLCGIYGQRNLTLAFLEGLCIPLCDLGNLMGTLHRPYI